MNRKHVESIVGAFLLIGHSFILFYIFYLIKDVFFINQALDLALIISPLFSAYLTLIVKFFLKPLNKKVIQLVGFNYTFVSFFYPFIFLVSIFLSIHLYKSQAIESFDNLKKIIGAIEVSFGIYLGIIIERLFPRVK
jgi:hypothetical protein